jgi:hypothetical protein
MGAPGRALERRRASRLLPRGSPIPPLIPAPGARLAGAGRRYETNSLSGAAAQYTIYERGTRMIVARFIIRGHTTAAPCLSPGDGANGRPLPDCPTSDQLVIEREPDGGGAGGDIEFGVDRGEMCANGARAEVEPFGDLRRRQALGDESQHFDFAWR